jgi:hypothetical protein
MDTSQWEDVDQHIIHKDGGTLLGIAALAIGGLVVARVIKKQSRAAELRKTNPSMSYHESICKAFDDLGQRNPFKI